MPRRTVLTFRRRPVKLTDVAKLQRWEATAAPLAVVMVSSLLGKPCRRYLATARHVTGNEWILGRHRTRAAAVKTCERYARLAGMVARSSSRAKSARSNVCSGQRKLF